MVVPLVTLAMLQPESDPKAGRKLIWSDEFSQPLSRKNWIPEVGKIRNNEAQFYTDMRQENCRVENGLLVLEARKEPYQGSEITSASITTAKAWKKVYVEVRAQYPTGRGTWPAIWMLGETIRLKDNKFVNWPKCGEIDLMENVGFDPELVHFNIHTQSFNHMNGKGKGASVRVPDGWKSMQVYGLDWHRDRLDFYFNGKKVFTFKNDGTGVDAWPYETPHYIILNLAIGGGWGGQKRIDDTIFPSRFLVDYVRVYQ